MRSWETPCELARDSWCPTPTPDFTLWHLKQNLQVRGRQKGGQEGQSFLIQN